MYQLALFFVSAEEAAAAHRRFERAGDFHHLIVIEYVWIHAFAGALQRQLLDVVIRIAVLMIQAVADGKHQFREYSRFTVFAQPGNAVTQDRTLDQA
ncbi:hypothetical protein D3C71_1485690 [compost metagenome]